MVHQKTASKPLTSTKHKCQNDCRPRVGLINKPNTQPCSSAAQRQQCRTHTISATQDSIFVHLADPFFSFSSSSKAMRKGKRVSSSSQQHIKTQNSQCPHGSRVFKRQPRTGPPTTCMTFFTFLSQNWVILLFHISKKSFLAPQTTLCMHKLSASSTHSQSKLKALTELLQVSHLLLTFPLATSAKQQS